jgi:hypothetical protein
MKSESIIARNPPMKSVSRFSVLALLALLPSCATVKPWERGNLARPVMNPSRDKLGLAMADHLYFSREASSGGGGVGGGGCGCN